MRITYLELLEMIRDNKAPKKIEFNCFTYEWAEIGYLSQTNAMCLNGFSDLELATEKLIELIEEEKKPIEKLFDNSVNYNFSKTQNGMTKEDRRLLDSNFIELGNKINEIIDYIKYKEEGKK